MSGAVALRAPKTIDAGQKLLERYSALSAELRSINASRDAQLAEINKAADTDALPITQELAKIAALLVPWWKQHAAELTKGKRKSITLGGCELGTRISSTSLATPDDLDAAIAKMRKLDWAEPLLAVKHVIEKKLVRLALAGPHKRKLQNLGFRLAGGGEKFFLAAIEQDGVVAEA